MRVSINPVLTASPEIDEMARRIVAGFAPERIILFGSHARGDAGPDSDVDLLVIMRSSMAPRQQVVEIRKVLADLPIAKDIIVVSPEYFDRYKDVVGTVDWPAVREGRVLYEQRASWHQRVCLGWREGDAVDAEITDYH